MISVPQTVYFRFDSLVLRFSFINVSDNFLVEYLLCTRHFYAWRHKKSKNLENSPSLRSLYSVRTKKINWNKNKKPSGIIWDDDKGYEEKSRQSHYRSDGTVRVVCVILMKGDPGYLSNTIRDISDCFLISWHAFQSGDIVTWWCSSRNFPCPHHEHA